MKRKLSKDNGYTLVEMIIVLAIIALLAAMSLISVTIIHSARAKEACVRVGSEINSVKSMNRTMTPKDGTHDGYALVIYKDSNGAFNCCVALHKESGGYDLDSDKNVKLSSSVDIKFTGSMIKADGSSISVTDHVPGELSATEDDDLPIYVVFDKRGNCYSGAGDIRFYKKNSNQVARVNVTSNGSIDVR